MILRLLAGVLVAALYGTVLAAAPWNAGPGEIFTPPAAGGYTGPCDTSSWCTGAWSVAFSPTAAYATSGGNAYDWQCTGGSPSTGTVVFASTGGVLASGTNSVAAMNTACGANQINVNALYDPITGNSTTILTAQGTRPRLSQNTIAGTLPCVQWDTAFSSNRLSTNTYAGGTAQPVTVAWYGRRTGNNTTQAMVWSSNNSSIEIGYANSANTIVMYSGAIATATATDAAYHSIIGVFHTTTSSINVDGSLTSGLSAGGGGMDFLMELGADGANADPLTACIAEAQFGQGVAMTSGNQTVLSSNVATRY